MKRSFLLVISLFFLNAALEAQEKSLQRKERMDSIQKGAAPRTKQTLSSTTDSKSRIGSQIVDDTTRNVYGPKTTRWTTEEEIFTGQRNYHAIDTSIINFHRWTYVQKGDNLFQDLGNNGTALYPIYPIINDNIIGVSPGFYGYQWYFRSQEPRLFDTKSPYTRMFLVWGGQGRAETSVEYSRNITSKWNLSFNYRPLITDKQILRQGKGDRQVTSHYYDISTHYRTPKEKYEVFTSYRRIRHRVNENGGIDFVTGITGDSTYALYFGNVSPRLTSAISREQVNALHLLHQYSIAKAQLYHIADFKSQVNWYQDNLAVEPDEFYDHIEIDSPAVVLDSMRFRSFENQVGIKGNLRQKKNIFYNGYYRLKSYQQYYKYLDTDTIALPGKGLEHYLGGQLQYHFDSLQQISAMAEYLNGGYIYLEGIGKFRWVDFTAKKTISKPTFLQTAYSGQFDLWTNQFTAPEKTQITFFPKVRWGPLFVSPGVTYTSLKNYIYFRQDTQREGQQVLPVQENGKIVLVVPEIRMDLAIIKRIHIRPQARYAHFLANPNDALRVPSLFVNSQVSYEDFWFHRNLQVQIGVDLTWRPAYQPMGYDPVIQTYYNQQLVTTPEYLMADVFFNGKMKHGRFFIKAHNVLQAFTKIGQMPTPYYRETKTIMDFGFDILMFD